jgi:hypothetical protein
MLAIETNALIANPNKTLQMTRDGAKNNAKIALNLNLNSCVGGLQLVEIRGQKGHREPGVH